VSPPNTWRLSVPDASAIDFVVVLTLIQPEHNFASHLSSNPSGYNSALACHDVKMSVRRQRPSTAPVGPQIPAKASLSALDAFEDCESCSNRFCRFVSADKQSADVIRSRTRIS
jgi:hypothetical protein